MSNIIKEKTKSVLKPKEEEEKVKEEASNSEKIQKLNKKSYFVTYKDANTNLVLKEEDQSLDKIKKDSIQSKIKKDSIQSKIKKDSIQSKIKKNKKESIESKIKISPQKINFPIDTLKFKRKLYRQGILKNENKFTSKKDDFGTQIKSRIVLNEVPPGMITKIVAGNEILLPADFMKNQKMNDSINQKEASHFEMGLRKLKKARKKEEFCVNDDGECEGGYEKFEHVPRINAHPFLSDDDYKGAIRFLYFQAGMPKKSIARLTGKNIKTVRRTIASTLNQKPRKPRKKKIYPMLEEFLLNLTKNKWTTTDCASLRSLKTKVYEKFNVDVSRSTIHRCLYKHYGRALRARDGLPLTVRHRMLRELFCKTILSFGVQGDDIFFTDEKRFVLKKAYNRSNDLIRIEKADKAAIRLGLAKGEEAFNAIKKEVEKYETSFMVAGGMSAYGVSKLIFCVGYMNENMYSQTLQYYKEDIVRLSRLAKKNLIFQQDGASSHTSKKSMSKIGQILPKNISWPPNSPDLSPIELLWLEVEKKLRLKEYANLVELREELLKIWNSIPIELCKKLIKSFDSRVVWCMKMRGCQYFRKKGQFIKTKNQKPIDWDILKPWNICKSVENIVVSDKQLEFVKDRLFKRLEKNFSIINKRTNSKESAALIAKYKVLSIFIKSFSRESLVNLLLDAGTIDCTLVVKKKGYVDSYINKMENFSYDFNSTKYSKASASTAVKTKEIPTLLKHSLSYYNDEEEIPGEIEFKVIDKSECKKSETTITFSSFLNEGNNNNNNDNNIKIEEPKKEEEIPLEFCPHENKLENRTRKINLSEWNPEIDSDVEFLDAPFISVSKKPKDSAYVSKKSRDGQAKKAENSLINDFEKDSNIFVTDAPMFDLKKVKKIKLEGLDDAQIRDEKLKLINDLELEIKRSKKKQKEIIVEKEIILFSKESFTVLKGNEPTLYLKIFPEREKYLDNQIKRLVSTGKDELTEHEQNFMIGNEYIINIIHHLTKRMYDYTRFNDSLKKDDIEMIKALNFFGRIEEIKLASLCKTKPDLIGTWEDDRSKPEMVVFDELSYLFKKKKLNLGKDLEVAEKNIEVNEEKKEFQSKYGTIWKSWVKFGGLWIDATKYPNPNKPTTSLKDYYIDN